MNDWFDFQGTTALITGGGGSLGRRQALALAARGATVVLADKNKTALEEAAALLRDNNLAPRQLLECDTTDATSVRDMVADAVRALGRIDILVNSMGMTRRAPSEDYPSSLFEQVLDINLDSVFFVCSEVGKLMIAQKGGRIINMGSIFATVGLAESPAYCASKGGVAQITRTLAVEWAPHGIAVNALLPSWFATPMGNVVSDRGRFYEHAARRPDAAELEARTTGRVPLGRLGRPDEIEAATLFLASAGASMVTGHLLAVDGGFLAQ